MYVIVGYSCDIFKPKVILLTNKPENFLSTMFINPVPRRDEYVFNNFDYPVDVYRVNFDFFKLISYENISKCICDKYYIAFINVTEEFNNYGGVNFCKLISKMNIKQN